MGYFSQSKGDKDAVVSAAEVKPKSSEAPVAAKPTQQVVSVLDPAMLITGNLVCSGSVEIHGKIIGDIHASHLLIRDGAEVQGKIMALETIIDGVFKGTIHSNSVKLERTAVVEGEIFNKSLTIEQGAQFEGASRRLAKPIDAPSTVRVKASKTAPAPTAETAPVNGPAN